MKKSPMGSTKIFTLLVIALSVPHLPERVWGGKPAGASGHFCPMKCRCVTVSHTQLSVSRLLQQYSRMFDWVEGQGAAVCWGRRKIPVNLLQDVRYLLMIGAHSRIGTIEDTTDPLQPAPMEAVETGIRKVAPGTFQSASGLIHLDLRGNKIKNLEAGSLSGLASLRVFSLKDNRLRALPVDAFQEMRNLSHLVLSGNNLRSLQGGSFFNNSNLLELDLSNNMLEFLDDSSLSGLSRLRLLNLSHGRLRRLPKDLLVDHLELRRLMLNNNKLESLPRKLFVKNLQLEVVSLKNNKLQRLPEYIFRHQTKLLQLDLSGNKMVELGNFVLAPAPSLLQVDVSSNLIETLREETFQNCTHLNSMDVSFNRLQAITDGTFGNLPSLRELSLAGNNISVVSPGSFQGLKQLETLELTGNALRRLQANSFLGLSSLLSLRLDDNDISDVEPGAFNVGRYGMSSKLTWINLRRNDLKKLTPYMFRGAPFVKMISLADNKIASVDSTALSGLRGLDSLTLQGNRIGSLPEGAFSGAVNIKTLDLSDNSIHRVDEATFRGLRSIMELTLANNELDETACDWLDAMTSLTELDLSGNRFSLVPSIILTSLHNLRRLSLAQNILDTFRIPRKDRLARLSRLDVSDNNLPAIEGSLQAIMGMMSSADLSNNPWNCDCALMTDVREMTSQGIHLENEMSTLCGTSVGNGNDKQMLISAAQEADLHCVPGQSELLNQPKSELRAVPQTRCRKLADVSKAAGRWPWYGVVWNTQNESLLCNAALIGSDWAVTTLRCLQQIRSSLSSTMPNIFGDIVRREQDSLLMAPPGLVIRLGKSRQLLDFEPGEQTFGIMNIHIPGNDRGAGLDRPILLQFASLVVASKNITPVCIAETPAKVQRAIVLGWGTKQKQTPPTHCLQSSRMKLEPCHPSSDVYDDVMFCGARERGKAVDYSIRGNMGGTAVMKRGRDDWALLGISTDTDIDGRSVFINISAYAGWIGHKTSRSQVRNQI